MTETDIPLLGPGRELTQSATQTVMTIGSALRERRFALGRYAWSDDRAAERAVQGHRRAADPPVRAMNEAEFDLFRREGTAGRAGYETRQTSGSHGNVRVTVGPMPEGRGWGLAAEATGPEDTTGQPGSAPARAQACVVAQSETEAKQLADELLTGGPARVQRLHEFGQYAAQRATHARSEVRETREQLIARTADAVRQVWRDDPDLAERMIQQRPGERDSVGTANEALGALARELEKLEDRGYAMTDVLSRIDRKDSLRRANNPAAMACYFVKRLAPDLQVVNLDDVEAEQDRQAEHAQSAAGPAAGSARTRTASDTRQSPPAESIVAADAALDGALRAAELPPESVRQAPGYDRLHALLAEQHAQGRDLDPLLAGLPARRLADARDPAAYLRAVIESRLTDNPLRKTRPDLHSAAALVERCLPRDASRAVTECESWPGLAARLSQWQAEGLPVTTMLESLPADRIRSAVHPATFVGAVLNSKAASHRKQHAARHDTGGRTADPDWPNSPEPRAASRPPRNTGRDAMPETAPDATAIDMGPSPSAIPLPPAAVDQLDPDSAVDRVALHATRGTGDPAQDAAIERALTAGEPASETDGDPGLVAAANAHAASERGRADLADRDAAHAASTPDDPATGEREDVTGQDHARTGDWDADHARAVADSDSAVAAAARADLSYRLPAGPAADIPAPPRRPSPRPRPTPGPRPQPVPRVTRHARPAPYGPGPRR